MNVGVITQARMASTRLPGKVLMTAGGSTMLDHHIDRLQRAGLNVIVATTVNTEDSLIVDLTRRRGVRCYRGSETDVLQRYLECARNFDLDVVVRVTSDCPLIDGDVVRAGLEEYLTAGDEEMYVSNTQRRTYPRGMDFEVFATKLLAEANANATKPYQREHVTPYFYDGSAQWIAVEQFLRPIDASGYRLTLDTSADYSLIRRLIEEFDGANVGCSGLVSLLEANPELVAINQSVVQKGIT